MSAFPNYAPTSRNFEPGVYPQRTYRTLAGVAVKRSFGNRPYGAKFEMEFANISDTIADEIISHYRTTTSAMTRFALSANNTAGMSASLVPDANGTADGLQWEYSAPPQIQSVRSGINTVRVTLIGEIPTP